MYFGYPLHYTSILNSGESVTTLFSVSDKITEYCGVKIGMYFGVASLFSVSDKITEYFGMKIGMYFSYPLHCTSNIVF